MHDRRSRIGTPGGGFEPAPKFFPSGYFAPAALRAESPWRDALSACCALPTGILQSQDRGIAVPRRAQVAKRTVLAPFPHPGIFSAECPVPAADLRLPS